MCQDVKNEQSGSSSVGLAIEKAIASGNFAAAKQAMLNAYNSDLGNVQKALGVIKSAPGNVQAAFKNLLTFVQQIRSDIQNASSEQGLIASFETLGKNTQLQTDGVTIANWYTGVCGGTLVTTTTARPASRSPAGAYPALQPRSGTVWAAGTARPRPASPLGMPPGILVPAQRPHGACGVPLGLGIFLGCSVG